MITQNYWAPFVGLKRNNMRDTNHLNEFVCGFYVPLDGEEFRIFVLNETRRESRGYILKLMYKNGRIKDLDFDDAEDVKKYPQVVSVFNHYSNWSWVNMGTKYHCYKYIVFGHGNKKKSNAKKLMIEIVNYIKTL